MVVPADTFKTIQKRGDKLQQISFSDNKKYGIYIKKRKIKTCIDIGPQNLRSFKNQNYQYFTEAVSNPRNVLKNAMNCPAWKDNWDMRMWTSIHSSNCEPTFSVACLRQRVLVEMPRHQVVKSDTSSPSPHPTEPLNRNIKEWGYFRESNF